MAELNKKPVFVLGGYFDESGIDRSDKVCVIAGFMGGPNAVKRVTKRWNKVLNHYEVRVPFHAIQFYAPKERIRTSETNPYRRWSSTRRKSFLNGLLDAISDRELRLKAVAVDSVAFRACTEQERRWLTGGRYKILNSEKWLLSGSPNSPYHYVFRAVVESCAQSLQGTDKVHLFMSDQKEYEGYALQLYQAILNRKPAFDFGEHLDSSITFASPADYALLQAADLVSYHLYQAALERRINPLCEATGVFRRLLDLAWESSDLQLATARTIAQHCEKLRNKLAETDRIATLRKTRLRSKVSHDPNDCEILGTIDAGGNYRPKAQRI